MNSYGTVLAIEFLTRPGVSFHDIVEEFDTAFDLVGARTRTLSWDCDDIAVIDRDELRVALGWLPATEADTRWHLIIAVGLPPHVEAGNLDLGSIDYIADKIAERTQSFMPCRAVKKGNATQPIGAELIDLLFELVRIDTSETAAAPSPNETPDTAPEADGAALLQEQELAPVQGDSQMHASPPPPETPKSVGTDLITHMRERFGITLTDSAVYNDPRRLSIHSLGLSLCLVAPPVGAGMVTYALLRDMIQDESDEATAKEPVMPEATVKAV